MAKIDTLVEDIYEVVNQNGGWDKTVSSFFSETLADTVTRRLTPEEEERKPSLRMSNVGTPCTRKLWYSINQPEDSEVLLPQTKLKFLFGDILEDLLIALAVAAGHEVTGMQDTMSISGIKGHRDCVIDGVTVDIKSASSAAFEKFEKNGLRGYTKWLRNGPVKVPAEEADGFGYIAQLSSYVYAGKDDPLVRDKTNGAFLVIDKQHGKLCLDMYDFTEELKDKKEYIDVVKEQVNSPEPPRRRYEAIPEGKSGNMKLGFQCSYCPFKKACWPGLRGFIYSRGPVYLTHCEKEPNVPEIKDD